MNYPPASAMALLASIHTGNGVGVDRGELVIPDPTGAPVLLRHDPADLDALESRGWLVIDADAARATDRGVYWLRRWLIANPEARRVAGRRELRSL